MTAKNVKITKTFQTRTGKTVTIEGELQLEKVNYADGDNIAVPCCEIYLNVTVEGHGSQGDWVRELTAAQKKQMPAGLDYTHRIGQLAITAEQAEIIHSVRSELEQHPAWQDKQATIARNQREIAEMEDRRSNSAGWCKRCQDWTYGDCGHR